VSETTAIVGGTIVLYLLAFFLLAGAVLLPLFTGLAIRYTFRHVRRKFSESRV